MVDLSIRPPLFGHFQSSTSPNVQMGLLNLNKRLDPGLLRLQISLEHFYTYSTGPHFFIINTSDME